MQENTALKLVDEYESEEPLDTLDAREELNPIEEARDELLRLLGGSWVMAAIIEAMFVAINLAAAAAYPLMPKSWKQSPVQLTAEKLAEVDEVREERVVERTEVVASSAANLRFVAKALMNNTADLELMQRLAPKDREWLLALSTSELGRIADAKLKEIALQEQDVPMIQGVRTPKQVENGIAAVISFGTHTAQPPMVTKEQILEARRNGVAGKNRKVG